MGSVPNFFSNGTSEYLFVIKITVKHGAYIFDVPSLCKVSESGTVDTQIM